MNQEQLQGISRLRGKLLNDIIQELKWGKQANIPEVNGMCECYMLLGKILRENVK